MPAHESLICTLICKKPHFKANVDICSRDRGLMYIARVFIHIQTLCIWSASALVRLRRCKACLSNLLSLLYEYNYRIGENVCDI